MTQAMTSELFFVSLFALLMVLIVLLVLCWILRLSRNRNFTELKISAGQPTRILTIRTDPNHANQLLDRLLDRVLLQIEPEPGPGQELGQEQEVEPGQELEGGRESHSRPDLEVFTPTASLPSRALNTLQNKVWRWITAYPPQATPRSPPSPPPSPPANQDQGDNLGPQWSDASHHASLSSQGSSYSSNMEEEQHDKSQL